MSKSFQYKKLVLFLLIINCSLLIVSCSKKLNPDPLSLTVRQNLTMLQKDPQFVMYFNFRKMRETEFWSKFISDSLFNAERSFGNFLSVIKEAAGVSVSNGIDELYFANSWIGDNSMVIKGTFDRKRVDDYVKSDTIYQKLNYANNTTIYKKSDINFYFYFKDEFTLCASNYLKQIENTLNISDTSKTGLTSNEDAMKAIEKIKYKENLWMMSNQKLFIRGIFENFADINKNKKPSDSTSIPDTTMLSDTTSETEGMQLMDIYKRITAVSFSLKMTDNLEFFMQNECEDDKSAVDLKNKLEGIIAIAKLTNQFIKKNPSAVVKLLDKVNINVYDKTTALDVKLKQDDITEIRKQKIF